MFNCLPKGKLTRLERSMSRAQRKQFVHRSLEQRICIVDQIDLSLSLDVESCSKRLQPFHCDYSVSNTRRRS